MNYKTCSRCATIKPLSDYHKSKDKRDGFMSSCRVCEKERKRLYHAETSSTRAEVGKKYRDINREKIALRKTNKRHVNIEATLKKERLYRDANKISINESNAKYSATEKGKISKASAKSKRRALKIATSDGSIPENVSHPLSEDLQSMLVRQKYRCVYCRGLIHHKLGNIHLDHIHPLSKGGTHSIGNVQWLCATCNLTKSDKVKKHG